MNTTCATTPTSLNLSLAEWMATAVKAAEELTRNQLHYDQFVLIGPVSELPVSDIGSYVALVGDEASMQLGLVASIDDCKRLAKKMLSMGDDEEIADSDMCDAVGEMVNILAGSAKMLVAERMPGFKLGLPLLMLGRLLASDRQEVGIVRLVIGPVLAYLIVLRHKGE